MKNPYATQTNEPIDGQFAEWFLWEQAREIERRSKLTPAQLQAIDAPRRQLQQRMLAESELVTISH